MDRQVISGFGLIILSMVLSMAVYAQNLVPNPSFEEYDFCSTSSLNTGWPDYWFIPSNGNSPDYFHECSEIENYQIPKNAVGNQEAFVGDAYIGLFAFNWSWQNSREAISCELNEPLQTGKNYVLTFKCSLADTALYAIRTLGFLLSNNLPLEQSIVETSSTWSNENDVLVDKVNWMSLTDTFTADGGERYLTIGNFEIDSNSDTLFVGNGGPLTWNKAYYYIDDVSLIPLDSLTSVNGHETVNIDVYPNPAQEQLTVQTKQSLQFVWLTDLSGRRLWTFEKRSRTRWETDLNGLPKGIYLIEATTEDGQRAVRKVVKM